MAPDPNERRIWTKPELKRIEAGSAEHGTTGRKNETGIPGNDKS